MKKKLLLFPLLISPLISGCDSKPIQGDFLVGNYSASSIEITTSELSAKLLVEHDTFFLSTHKGESCICWTDFQNVLTTYNEQTKEDGDEYVPFFSYDTTSYETGLKIPGIDEVMSGYVDFYVIIEGEIVEKYSKSAKKDYQFFDDVATFKSTIEKYMKAKPIPNYAYVSYDYARAHLINKDNNEFILLTIRSGCGDCSYLLLNVLTPWLVKNGSKIPVYLCDIERYKDTKEYDDIRHNLKITEASDLLGYDVGRVPTYQYWKNGQLMDAGVYGNDFFVKDEETNKIKISKSYFDGTRDLKYTDINLIEQFNALDTIDASIKPDGTYYLNIKKEADFHDPLLIAFLSYYCK